MNLLPVSPTWLHKNCFFDDGAKFNWIAPIAGLELIPGWTCQGTIATLSASPDSCG
jgi:hypothetical protein